MPRPITVAPGARRTTLASLPDRARRLAARTGDQLILRAHRLAVRWDLPPQGFGDAEPVDEDDPRELVREWRRQLRIWAAYSPEEVFAVKVGGAVLAAALVLLWIGVRSLR
ncbi:MAG: hypothetical protein JWQ46_2502 [Phenylobacterium sp.]|jgi:hypothetical protein|nr:hypothetical protein [Phenylobacterium sp.]